MRLAQGAFDPGGVPQTLFIARGQRWDTIATPAQGPEENRVEQADMVANRNRYRRCGCNRSRPWVAC